MSQTELFIVRFASLKWNVALNFTIVALILAMAISPGELIRVIAELHSVLVGML